MNMSPSTGSGAFRPRPAGPHFEVLDGLRGVAALCVFFYHSGNHAYAANGFLAVDFFFMLSGFVVAHSYDTRLRDGRMTLAMFVRRRVARLYPMVWAGVMLGAAVLLAHNIASPDEAYDFASMAGWIVSGLLVVPYLAENPFLNAVFPVNVVLWSLFLELLANIAYAAGIRWVTPRTMGVALLCGMIATIWLGPIDGGGSIDTFATGFARVLAGFAAGILLFAWSQSGRFPSIGIGLVGTALPLVVLTVLPRIHAPIWLPGIYLIFAATIVVALNAPAMSIGMLRACRLLGLVSYPLYLLHRPITSLVVGFGKIIVPLSDRSYPWFVAVALVMSILSSIVVVKAFETPARRWLTLRLARDRE